MPLCHKGSHSIQIKKEYLQRFFVCYYFKNRISNHKTFCQTYLGKYHYGQMVGTF